MEPSIEAAKAEFLRAKGRLERALANTPDDRINWSPSPSSRTPIHQVVHCGLSTTGIQEWLMGKPFPFADMAAMDLASREKERGHTTRESAVALLESTSAEYVRWLESLSTEQANSTIESDFGSFPMAVAVTFVADHIRGHAAQLDYMQTIYGDMDWHIG